MSLFMVCTNSFAPISFIRSCTSPAVSSSAIEKLCCSKILPVSISCCSLKVVTPVSFSPLITAQLMGAAPRYCGSSEPCTLTVPMGGIFQTISGSIRKATTICMSAFNDFNSSTNKGSFSFTGCSIFNPFSKAYFFTALSVSFMPLPAGLSGAVTTAAISYPAFTNASKEATANSGVPINTMRIFFLPEGTVCCAGIIIK